MAPLLELPAYTRLPQVFQGGSGCELVLTDGTQVLDLYGGHCVNTLGAGDPGIADACNRQWKELSFASNLLQHHARQDFLHAFAANLPAGNWQVFCSNSGAEANENALKTALAATGRSRVVAFEGAFHGRTAAAAAVSDAKTPAFPSTPFEVLRLPWGDAAAVASAVDASVGAVILEPIQSLAGVRMPPPGFLQTVRAATTAAGALLIFDEVQTGNGRLGSPWAAQHFGVIPDGFTTAKGAAGGLPIGLTMVSDAVADRFPAGLCGSTFGGGPVVLAAATEVARRIAAPGLLENVSAASAALRAAAAHGPIKEVRGAGLLLGLVLEDGLQAAEVRDHLLRQGVLVGTSNDAGVLRLCPPLILTPGSADRLAQALDSLGAIA